MSEKGFVVDGYQVDKEMNTGQALFVLVVLVVYFLNKYYIRNQRNIENKNDET